MQSCMEVPDWDELRVVLAVSRAGTLSQAARLLGVDQSTVSRKLADLTARLGVALVERRDGRYVSTAAGRLALPRAARVEAELDSLVREVADADARSSGPIRLSAPPGLSVFLIAPRLAQFHARNPGIELLLSAETELANLSRREADVALRYGRSQQRELVVRRVARIPFTLYASAQYLRRRPRGATLLRPDDELILMHEESGAMAEATWHEGLGGRVRMRVRSPLALREAALAGAGIALLGGPVARHPSLRALPGAPVSMRDLFLVFHRALRTSARVRAVCAFAEACVG